MGSYSILYIGDLDVSESKSHISLEDLLFFNQDDFVVGEEKIEGDTYDTYRYVTTVRQARHRVDERGLDMAMCRRLFEEFRSDEIYDVRFHVEDGQTLAEDNYLTNPVNFDRYLDALRKLYADKRDNAWAFWGYSDDKTHLAENPDVQWIFKEDFFHDTANTYFDDVASCVQLRCLLEVAPDSAEVVLDLSELVHSGWIASNSLPDLFDFYMRIMFRRIELDYRIYGFVIENDPLLAKRLSKRIQSLSEDAYIDHILLPLLDRMGFTRLRRVQYHGHGEFGSDILPFRYTTPLGTVEYYALQAKAKNIHGTSASSGNAGELISQATQALKVSFVDDLDNERKHIDKFIVAATGKISPDARRTIEEAVAGDRKIVFLDLDAIIALIRKNRLVQHVLFSEAGEMR